MTAENDRKAKGTPKGRFQKGKSGNPRGRPRKKVADHDFGLGAEFPTGDAILRESRRTITATDASGTEQLEPAEALFRALANKAYRGSPWAAVQALKLLKAEDERDHQKKLKNFEQWIEYRREEWIKMAVAAAKGEPYPEPLPHPDDLTFDHKKLTVTIDGPADEQSLATYQLVAKMLDLAYELSVFFEEFAVTKLGSGSKATEIGVYMTIYSFYIQFMPTRFRKLPQAYDASIKHMCFLGTKAWEKSLKARCGEIGLPFWKTSPDQKRPIFTFDPFGVPTLSKQI